MTTRMFNCDPDLTSKPAPGAKTIDLTKAPLDIKFVVSQYEPTQKHKRPSQPYRYYHISKGERKGTYIYLMALFNTSK